MSIRLISCFILIYIAGCTLSKAQTCTLVDPDGNSATSTIVCWAGCSPTVTCSETGSAPVSGNNIIVPVGVLLDLKNSGALPTNPTAFHTGNLIIFGDVINNKSQIQLNGSIIVKNGGSLTLDKIMYLGSTSGCGYTLMIENGGELLLSGSGASDRLVICNNIVAQSGGGCNPYPAGPTPYCEPAGGFDGPFTFDQNGLPIELLFFNGKQGLDNISLSWATASELNFDYFDIEKSNDGLNFKSIATVKGNGTTSERHDYELVDEKPMIGKNYYRLKSVDFDGYTEYFNVVMVDFDGQRNFSIYPNPADGVAIKAETNFTPAENSFVTIYTSMGAEVGRYQVMGELSDLTMPVKLESGWYYARFISSEFTAVSRFLVR